MQLYILFLLSCLFAPLSIFSEDNLKPSVEVVPTTSQERTMGAQPYKFKFDNFPINKEINILYNRRLKGDPKKFTVIDAIKIDENNLISINNQKFAVYALDPKGFFEGERVSYRFQLKNGALIAETSYFPRQIYAKSENGTFSVTAELVSLKPMTNYVFAFEGIVVGEIVSVTSQSEGENLVFDFPIQPNALFRYSPDVVDKKGGNATLTIKRKNGDSATLNLPWGSSLKILGFP